MRRELDRDLASLLYSASEARARHARAVFWRVYLPLAAGFLLIVALMLAAVGGGGGSLTALVDVSAVFLVFSALLAGWAVFVAAFFLVRITGAALQTLPRYTGPARNAVALVSFRVRKAADQLVGLVHVGMRLQHQAGRAVDDAAFAVRRFLKQFLSRG